MAEFFDFEARITINYQSMVEGISIVVAAVIFIATEIFIRRRDLRSSNREIYQSLELASNEVFRFEANHLELIRPVWEIGTPIPPKNTAEYTVVINYVCQILNLFEMSIRFCRQKIMPKEIFSTWLVWFYEVANAPHFPEVWAEVRLSYTHDLQIIMDEAVRPKTTESSTPSELKIFFNFVANVMGFDEAGL